MWDEWLDEMINEEKDMDKDEFITLGAFLLFNDCRILTNEELKDVQNAINSLLKDNCKGIEAQHRWVHLREFLKKYRNEKIESYGPGSERTLLCGAVY